MFLDPPEVLSKIWANLVKKFKPLEPRTASLWGQEIIPMVSGDVPRYTKEV